MSRKPFLTINEIHEEIDRGWSESDIDSSVDDTDDDPDFVQDECLENAG